MPKTSYIELGNGEQLPILFEDRSIIAIDKPRGWMLVPYNWQKTPWNLQAAIDSSLRAGSFWARSRNLKFLRHVHRLDADTTGILVLAKSLGAVESIGRLFESRQMEKVYLAVVQGPAPREQWTCRLSVCPDPKQIGKMRVDERGKSSETQFRVVQQNAGRTLIEARPLTGRTHQIRLHLAESAAPVLGDELYGSTSGLPLALRAVSLAYRDPFTKRPVRIVAPREGFLKEFGFEQTLG